jgi:small conductance mechanosensitive channel
VNVGVSYTADIDETRAVLTEAVNSVRGALRDPAPAVTLLSLGDCAVNWQVQIWAPTPDLGAVKQELIRCVKRSLDDAGLEIPFPQMDLNLRSLPREMASDQQQRKAA